MKLSQLTEYAAEKYGIREEFKWPSFPGFSVLADPRTGHWAALLMRLRDPETGAETEKCDLKCGQKTLSEIRAPFITLPARKGGHRWIGISFDETADPETVFRLFDRALLGGGGPGCTIVLESGDSDPDGTCRETPLPAAAPPSLPAEPNVPEKIIEMKKLYDGGGFSREQSARNFVRQGRFMADYEDDAEWTGDYLHYYPTYRDLSLRQLRGYFGWRTRLRRGEFRPISASLAYLYLYELLCGIGAGTPDETLAKMEEFETGYLDSGIGEAGIRRNLRRWMFEYAVIRNLPLETVLKYADPALLEKDANLAVLKDPKPCTDEEVFAALAYFGGKTLTRSPLLSKENAGGKHLFAGAWRHLSEHGRVDGENLFTACFGKRRAYRWYPLFNAVYWDEHPVSEAEIELNSCRAYQCRGGIWKEKRYENIHFNRARFLAVLREADRIFRREFKTGRYLAEKPDNAWITPYIEEAAAAERRARAEAARPKITFSLSEIEQIRRDAQITRDRLLTEDEREGAPPAAEEPAAAERDIPAEPAESAQSGPEPAKKEPAAETAPDTVPRLDPVHAGILAALCEGRPVGGLIRAGRLIPSVVADRINEELFDEIGDNALECDGSEITLVEDYREDLERILRG